MNATIINAVKTVTRKSIAGIATVPAVIDEIRKVRPELTSDAIRKVMYELHLSGEAIHLGLVNDRRMEPRAAEMIETPKGLRGYVQVI